MRPHISGETVMTIVRHADRLILISPGDRDQHWTKNFLARQTPVVGGIREHRRNREIPRAERTVFRRQSTKHQASILAAQVISDITAYFTKLLLIDDGADVARFVQRIAYLESLCLCLDLIQEAIENIGMEKQSRAGGARLALPGETH